MKKLVYVIMPILLVVVLVAAIGTVILFYRQYSGLPEQKDPNGITIFDAQGKILVTAKKTEDIYNAEYWPYLQVVLTELTGIIAQKDGCSPEDAEKQLFDRGYQIHTAFLDKAFESLKAVDNRWGQACNTALAITDTNGSLLAVSCSDTEGEQINYAQERRSPYSSFKALSVYTPAVEKGIVHWSTMFEDSPYKQLKDENGAMQDWPANASGTYSREDVTAYEALRTSLNTAAVKCLANVGVEASMKFLQDNFGIPLKEETYVVETYGKEEVIGNIALGYLETGITPVEMAGYYQIFANGGKYLQPQAIIEITCDGTSWYKREDSPKQVISSVTADIMNKFLQGVVAKGGTGELAFCKDVAVAGKTGTGDNYADNWFVGVTPEYSLAIWHGQHDSNQAAEMFAAVVNKLYAALPNAKKEFVAHENVCQMIYCAHSGKAFSTGCTRIDMGYYTSENVLPLCDVCGNTKKSGG